MKLFSIYLSSEMYILMTIVNSHYDLTATQNKQLIELNPSTKCFICFVTFNSIYLFNIFIIVLGQKVT